ncbi:MAG: transketolase [Candidatus Poribacteria bacterium]|nr:transketolase [Candidatus Poribacteria bacterium]MDE0505439.1 transketolase [Candidatus Poribacteria bacterium]
MSPIRIRQLILQMAKRADVGHIGSALSIADIIAALYGDVLRIVHLDDPNRDRFVLSKGRAAMALYAALYLKEWLTKETLETYCMDPVASEKAVASGQCPVTSEAAVSTDHWQQATGHYLGVHPEHTFPGVDFSTGSLGHGLAIGTGAALAARLEGCSRRVFVLISDAECNEGSNWESVMLAAHHRLANLIAIIDLNSQQAFGYTADVLNLSPMREKWEAFGWDVHEVDGHNVAEITETIQKLHTISDSPHVLIARTTFGKGVSYMENRIKWHYMPMSDAEYQQAVEAVASGQ